MALNYYYWKKFQTILSSLNHMKHISHKLLTKKLKNRDFFVKVLEWSFSWEPSIFYIFVFQLELILNIILYYLQVYKIVVSTYINYKVISRISTTRHCTLLLQYYWQVPYAILYTILYNDWFLTPSLYILIPF